MLDLAQGKFVLPERWLNGAVKVLIVGAGGTGSECLDALVRLHYALTHIGHPDGLSITLQDGDTVSSANVARQRFVPSDVGHNKAELLARRYGLMFGLSIRALPTYALKRHVAEFAQFDLVITCVDRARFRVAMGKHWATRKCETLWLDHGNG